MITNTKLDEPVSFPKNDDQWHSFLDGNIEKALSIKRFLAEVPESSAFINSGDIHEATDVHFNKITDELMGFLGSWEVPDTYSSGRHRTWVNPHNPHRHLYSDAAARCECGIPMLRQSFSDNQEQPGQIQKHEGICCRRWRVQTRGRLWQKRRDLIEEVAGYGWAMRNIAPRIGYETSSDHVPHLARQCGLDVDELTKTGRSKVARSLVVLLRDYQTDDVAELYELSRSAANRIVREETTANSSKLYSHRRRFNKTGSVMPEAAD